MKTIKFIFLYAIASFLIISCDKEDDSCKTTYTQDIKSIIDNSCAYSGCHSGDDAGPWVPDTGKDYTNYEGLLENLNSGVFHLKTLELQSMPPIDFVPDGKPLELTSEEMDLLNCWIDNGFPKN